MRSADPVTVSIPIRSRSTSRCSPGREPIVTRVGSGASTPSTSGRGASAGRNQFPGPAAWNGGGGSSSHGVARIKWISPCPIQTAPMSGNWAGLAPSANRAASPADNTRSA